MKLRKPPFPTWEEICPPHKRFSSTKNKLIIDWHNVVGPNWGFPFDIYVTCKDGWLEVGLQYSKDQKIVAGHKTNGWVKTQPIYEAMVKWVIKDYRKLFKTRICEHFP